jgi:probable rRNA maturation factor
MSNRIHLQVEEGILFNPHSMDRIAEATLQREEISSSEMTIVFTGNDQIREMNRKFAGEDKVTDVLSFPDGSTDPDSELRYLGDILIAIPVAREQAKARAIELQNEISLLIVHGTLHLLGYDHANPDDKSVMWDLQNKILKELGVSGT